MRHDRFEGDEALDDFRVHPMLTLAVVMLAGSVGVGFRYLLDAGITARAGDDFPWSTLIVNIVGALVLGLVIGMLSDQPSGGLARAAIGMGLIGGFTTFSAFALETVALAEDGLVVRAAIYVGATNVLGISATIAGLVAGRSFG